MKRGRERGNARECNRVGFDRVVVVVVVVEKKKGGYYAAENEWS